MASPFAFQLTKSLDPEVYLIGGRIETDASGNVVNTTNGTSNGQYGTPLYYPRGITSVVHTTTGNLGAAGIYVVNLTESWVGLLDYHADVSAENSAGTVGGFTAPQGTVVGTVNLNTLTLSTLNGLTLKTTGNVGSLYTTTFTTPTSIADIAAQINAGNTGTSVLASIVPFADGSKHLKVVSTTLGVTSTLAIDTTSTAKTQLGMSTTTATALSVQGTIKLLNHNVKGVSIVDIAAQTLTLMYEKAGVPTDLVSGSFYIGLKLKNIDV